MKDDPGEVEFSRSKKTNLTRYCAAGRLSIDQRVLLLPKHRLNMVL